MGVHISRQTCKSLGGRFESEGLFWASDTKFFSLNVFVSCEGELHLPILKFANRPRDRTVHHVDFAIFKEYN